MEAASADIARALLYLERDRSAEAQEYVDRARAKPKPPQLQVFLAYAAVAGVPAAPGRPGGGRGGRAGPRRARGLAARRSS